MLAVLLNASDLKQMETGEITGLEGKVPPLMKASMRLGDPVTEGLNVVVCADTPEALEEVGIELVDDGGRYRGPPR